MTSRDYVVIAEVIYQMDAEQRRRAVQPELTAGIS